MDSSLKQSSTACHPQEANQKHATLIVLKSLLNLESPPEHRGTSVHLHGELRGTGLRTDAGLLCPDLLQQLAAAEDLFHGFCVPQRT